MAGIYIHIPFCSQFCTYCNFYSVKQLGLRDSFVKALKREAESNKEFFTKLGSSVTTIYIGGGTPSVLKPSQLSEIVAGIGQVFDLNRVEEFTIEVNPNDITPEYAAFLVGLGVNRVSMGVQSFIDEHLKWMNRRHNALEGEQAYRILREAGITNISLDLIFGYESLSAEQWAYNIGKAMELAPEHISAYQMSVEPGSALNALVRKGLYTVPAQEVCESQYRMLQQMLLEAGYVQYEISNFARKGRVRVSEGSNLFEKVNRSVYYSIHNSSYWSGVPYLGLGPGAHSFTGDKRIWNSESVKRYCAWYNNVENVCSVKGNCNDNRILDDILGYEELTEEDKFNETIMLGLRRTCGFSLKSLDPFMLRQITPELERFIGKGLLIKESVSNGDVADENDTVIRIPQEKLFISDFIIRELFV